MEVGSCEMGMEEMEGKEGGTRDFVAAVVYVRRLMADHMTALGRIAVLEKVEEVAQVMDHTVVRRSLQMPGSVEAGSVVQGEEVVANEVYEMGMPGKESVHSPTKGLAGKFGVEEEVVVLQGGMVTYEPAVMVQWVQALQTEVAHTEMVVVDVTVICGFVAEGHEALSVAEG
jgi:hypothetical protein